jgi:hypothetical protein
LWSLTRDDDPGRKTADKERENPMNAQLQVAYGIVAGRAWSDQDHAQLRAVELDLERSRRSRRWHRQGR